ncbi:MAG: class I SAM-dependent methyltransferase [Gemmatimonadaceae bacterium]|nr:class I SAM-dependent methyltransferase [Gemmatimonadaceae bacterium]
MTGECPVCCEMPGGRVTAREMMFGSGEPFTYAECAGCGCLHLLNPPADLSRYYPSDYYSFQPAVPRSGIRRWLRKRRNAGTFARGRVDRLLALALPHPHHGADRWFRRIAVQPDSRILDVGCGDGHLLRDLRDAGFTNLQGIDPFTPVETDAPVRIHRRTLREVEGSFDVVMLHHTLEHVEDQHATLRDIARVLDPRGTCLIRIPVVPSAAWNEYREDWVQLDAPRHFVIHTARSLSHVAGNAGLDVVTVEYDSTELQFLGSEHYRRGQPLTTLWDSVSRDERRDARRRARDANAAGQGDQAAFYLQHRQSR